MTDKRHAVSMDRWDREDLSAIIKADPGMRRARKKLAAFARTGREAVDDVFMLLHSADPHLVSRSEMEVPYLVNHAVAAEMMQLPALRRLRDHTVVDPVATADAAAQLEPTLETVFDQLLLARQLADRIVRHAQELAQLREALERTRDDLDEVSGDLSDAEAALRVARKLADLQALVSDAEAVQAVLERGLDELLEGESVGVSLELNGAVGRLGDQAAEAEAVATAWGFERGQLHRLPSAERLRLARALNTPRMKTIADLFGRIRNFSLSASAEVDDVVDEVVDLELGADLSRVVPAELLGLATPETEATFLARWADRELMQYHLDGEDEAGRGGIVMCIDGSYSMANEREHWAKAVMLVLLHQAKAQGRAMHVIHFGYHQTVLHSFVKPGDFSPERILATAEEFWASGTDFTEPMTVAVGLLGEEFARTSRTQADVVFCTDDECYVPDEFMAEYLSEMHRMGARTWGVAVVDSVDPEGALAQMSEGRVMTVKDLHSGRDLRPMLLGTR